MTTLLTGWLFDVYPYPGGLAIWIIDVHGTKHRVTHRFVPSFFLQLSESDRRRAELLCARCPIPLTVTHAERTEVYSGDRIGVLHVHVHNAMHFKEAVWYCERFFPHFAFYNSDVPVAQQFLYEQQLFLLAFGEFEVTDARELVRWEIHDDRESNDYQLPPLAMMELRTVNDYVPPKYRKHLQLEIEYDGRTYALEQQAPRDVIESLNWHLYHCDPDIVLTEYGDASLMPQLTALARQERIPLLFNRDTQAEYRVSRESSFFQYGKIVHKDGAFELAGRWHVDVRNSFTVAEADLDGLFEMIRLTQMVPQRQARASIGTSMSSMQLSWAYRNGVLIPAKKREPEDFKSAATLLLADRGGLIFNPPFGYHDDVAELDFVSMYPTIMVEKNVSPETVNCRCCKNAAVPELNYTICEKREGLVPATLRSVVKKRAEYKRLKKFYRGKDEALFKKYDHRQNALKWMLVSCFGYLGYKNARFGRIEAHESVNAFSRDAILKAKEIAESHGFRMLHAIIDCVWLKKEGATEADYEALAREIGHNVGIDISLEGIYHWILFPASKMDPEITTANRYVGWYHHGEMKMRGIESRRRDTCLFLKHMQQAMLNHLADARNGAEVEARVPELLEIARQHLAVLRSGKANPMELVLKRHITKEADDYANNSISAVVAKLTEQMGVHLSPGESIEFIILDSTGKKKPEKAKPLALYAFEDGYDIEQYTEFALKAVETLLLPFGYDVEKLRQELVPETVKKKRLKVHKSINDVLPLFEEQSIRARK